MSHPSPQRSLHLGMTPGELDGKPYAEFWNPRMAPLPLAAREALLNGPQAAPLLPTLRDAPRLLEAGDQELENGYGLQRDGSLCVALRTELPDTTPEMIDWWFGWHSAEPQRYKLWHPRAHVHAQWSEPESAALAATQGRPRYVGRTSLVDEYLGSAMSNLSIRFLEPSELGFSAAALADSSQATAVCARGGFAGYPVAAAYLVHHVRRVAGGSEMRSRFWLGGPYAEVAAGGLLSDAMSAVARRLRGPSLEEGRDLLVHCAQEMAHLGSFLPRLHARLHQLP